MSTRPVIYRTIDLSHLVLSVCSQFDELARRRNVSFHVNVPPILDVELDPERIELVLQTLLFGAFRHAPIAGDISVSLTEMQDRIVLSIKDSGATVAPDHTEGIFDSTRRVDRSLHLELAGVSTSLATCRQLVALHGGVLTVATASGERCEFRATLPKRAPIGVSVAPSNRAEIRYGGLFANAVADELEEEADLEADPPSGDTRPVVLIVEDSRSIRRAVAECLKRECSVVHAENGAEGLAKAIELKPDLIITDVIMPEMDGEEMLKRVREHALIGDTPILVLTGISDAMRVVRLLERGAQDVLRKPLLLPEVRVRVKGLLATKRVRDILNATLTRQESDLVKLADRVAHHQQEMHALVAKLHEARRAADTMSRVKSNFLRVMSHELKTPITAIQLYTSILDAESSEEVPAAVRNGLKRVQRSSRRLVDIVDTCTEWARVESGRCKVCVEPFDIGAIVERVVEEVSEPAEKKGVAIQLRRHPDLPALASDERMVRLVLLNLLTYAVNTVNNGNLRVAVTKPGEMFKVSIHGAFPSFMGDEDTLSGSTDIASIIGSGSGLGLSVVRDIARAFEAKVEMQEANGSGMAVVFTVASLPREQTKAHSYLPPPLESVS